MCLFLRAGHWLNTLCIYYYFTRNRHIDRDKETNIFYFEFNKWIYSGIELYNIRNFILYFHYPNIRNSNFESVHVFLNPIEVGINTGIDSRLFPAPNSPRDKSNLNSNIILIIDQQW